MQNELNNLTHDFSLFFPKEAVVDCFIVPVLLSLYKTLIILCHNKGLEIAETKFNLTFF